MGLTHEGRPKWGPHHGGSRPAGPWGPPRAGAPPWPAKAMWGLVPHGLAKEGGLLPPPIYRGAPLSLLASQSLSLSRVVPEYWSRICLRGLSTKIHRHDFSASVELFIFRRCRWTGAGGSSLHRTCVEPRRRCPLRRSSSVRLHDLEIGVVHLHQQHSRNVTLSVFKRYEHRSPPLLYVYIVIDLG